MELDLSGLKKAIISLESSINVTIKKIDEKVEEAELETLRAGVIQNFEFTYELSWKIMKRWLEININSEEIDGVSRKELFRIARENKLITDINKWMEFHRARNETSHMYDANMAEEVFGYSILFLDYAKELLEVLESKK